MVGICAYNMYSCSISLRSRVYCHVVQCNRCQILNGWHHLPKWPKVMNDLECLFLLECLDILLVHLLFCSTMLK